MPLPQGLSMRFREWVKGLKRNVRKRFRGEYVIWVIFFGISFSFLWSAFAGKHGLFSYIRLKNDLEQLEFENKKLLERNHALQKDIFLLRNDLSHIERIIREEYGYISDGEMVYLFDESGTPKENGQP